MRRVVGADHVDDALVERAPERVAAPREVVETDDLVAGLREFLDGDEEQARALRSGREALALERRLVALEPRPALRGPWFLFFGPWPMARGPLGPRGFPLCCRFSFL